MTLHTLKLTKSQSHTPQNMSRITMVPYSFTCMHIIIYIYDNDHLRRLMVELACLKCAVYTTEYALYCCSSLFIILHIQDNDQLRHWLMVEFSVPQVRSDSV